MRHAPAILLTATILIVAVSIAQGAPINGAPFGLAFLWWVTAATRKVRTNNE
jgi:hypothetical protein